MSLKYVPPSYLTPRPGEITLKSWVHSLAESEGVTPSAIYNRIARGRLKPPITRRENGNVVFVREVVS